jgi:hypothetical protein
MLIKGDNLYCKKCKYKEIRNGKYLSCKLFNCENHYQNLTLCLKDPYNTHKETDG